MSDLLKAKHFPFFFTIFEKMKETSRYEAKIEVLLATIPIMQRQEAFQLMRIIIEIIDEPAQNSFLRNNINPLRVGLMLYRLISELAEEFNYSAPTANATLEKVQE